MTRPLLSLVVPVYNVAPYLPTCLSSLATLRPAPEEIIAVDDGSTDGCSQILADYVGRMPNLRVIRQDNGGLSSARNTGLDSATGRYVAFVDSDDFVQQDSYVQALRFAESDGLDMVLFNATYHFEGRQSDRPIYTDWPESRTVMTGADWLRERLKKGRFLHMVWMHLYRRDFIEANCFRFVPHLIHEDVIWSTQALLAARRVRYDPAPRYHYRIPIRRFSAEEKAVRLQAVIDSSITNARTLADMTLKVGDPELRRLLQEQWVDGAFSVFHKANQLPRSDRALRLTTLRRDGFFRLLWRNAIGISQRRRILRNYLRSFLAS